jgi:hypothetical protein
VQSPVHPIIGLPFPCPVKRMGVYRRAANALVKGGRHTQGIGFGNESGRPARTEEEEKA